MKIIKYKNEAGFDRVTAPIKSIHVDRYVEMLKSIGATDIQTINSTENE